MYETNTYEKMFGMLQSFNQIEFIEKLQTSNFFHAAI